jgi:hypothetical protein
MENIILSAAVFTMHLSLESKFDVLYTVWNGSYFLALAYAESPKSISTFMGFTVFSSFSSSEKSSLYGSLKKPKKKNHFYTSHCTLTILQTSKPTKSGKAATMNLPLKQNHISSICMRAIDILPMKDCELKNIMKKN